MPDWTDTLDRRQAGELEGFLAVNVPLEDQGEQGTTAEGPINVERTVADDDDALGAMTKAELLEEATRRGLEVDEKATKAQLIADLRE